MSRPLHDARVLPTLRTCVLALLACVAAVAGCRPPVNRPNVLLVVIDTLRADRVSSYGYARATTPYLDAIGAQGIRFENAYSTSSWTLPAHASIFTGRFPIEHGATQENSVVDLRLPTLAERFAAHGYATFAISGNGVVNRGSGLVRGFERFDETWRADSDAVPASPAQHPNTIALREALAQLDADQPFFAFVNFVEVHGPYTPPSPYREQFLSPGSPRALVRSATTRGAPGYYSDPSSISAAEFRVLNDLYDGEVAYTDALVGGLIEELASHGRLDDTLVVITSDHGENLGDHGHFRHVFSLYNTTVRIPLIIRLPGGRRAAEVRREPVSLIDLYPTLLGAAGIDPGDAEPRARDLLAARIDDAAVFAEYYFPLQVLHTFENLPAGANREGLAPYMRRLRSVQRNGWRLIWSSDGRHELYQVDPDSDERIDRSRDPSASGKLQEMLGLIAEYVAAAGGDRPLPERAGRLIESGAFGDLDPDARRNLQDLGYLPE